VTRGTEVRTNADMVIAMLANVSEAAGREGRLRALWDSLAPGDPRFAGEGGGPTLLEELRRAYYDQKHWRRELRYWRGRCVEAGDQAPALSVQAAKRTALGDEMEAAIRRRMNEQAGDGAAELRAPPARDRRLPREAGDDDGELPF
jgi:hypothetical protein